MIDAPIALAFVAGLVATLNPCGFAMLPAYLSYFVGISGDDVSESRAETLRRSLVVGGTISTAFVAVFGFVGLLITAGFRAVTGIVPWLALAIGGAITILGVAMLRGYEPTVALPKAKRASKGQGLRPIFGFGVSYAIASLSCTLPVFLSVVALQTQRTNLVSGVLTFVVYGVGMSMLLLGVTIAIGLGRRALVARLRRSVRLVNRISGGVLVVAGVYIVWFWTTNLRSGADALGDSGAFRFVESLSQRAFDLVGGNALWWGLGLALLIGTAAVVAFRREDADDGDEEAPIPAETRG